MLSGFADCLVAPSGQDVGPSGYDIERLAFTIVFKTSDRPEMHPRILQELRLIRWPWCFMTLAGLAPLIKPLLKDTRSDLPDGIAVFGFFGCAAFLTAFSFRDASRIPALPLASHSDVSRCKLWSQKTVVLLTAVACAGLIACAGQTLFGNLAVHDLHANAIEPVLLLAVIVCSTGFWTLLTRSITGGILLTILAQFALYLFLILFVTAIDRMAPYGPGATRLSHQPEIHSALSWFVGGFGLSYALFMLWLGRRKFIGITVPNDTQSPGNVSQFQKP